DPPDRRSGRGRGGPGRLTDRHHALTAPPSASANLSVGAPARRVPGTSERDGGFDGVYLHGLLVDHAPGHGPPFPAVLEGVQPCASRGPIDVDGERAPLDPPLACRNGVLDVPDLPGEGRVLALLQSIEAL